MKLVWSAVLCQAIFVGTIMVITHIPSSGASLHANSHGGMMSLKNAYRPALGNSVALILGYFVNAYIISRWKIFVQGRIFWIRSIVSSATGEVVYNMVWAFIVMSGVLSLPKIFTMMASMLLFKIIYSIVAVIPAVYLAGYLKKVEGVDVYDDRVNYNPFSLNSLFR